MQAERLPVSTPSHLGPLTQLTIGLRPSLPGDRWHLDRVEITDEGTGLLYIFFCQAWLGDDGQESVTLKVSGFVQNIRSPHHHHCQELHL